MTSIAYDLHQLVSRVPQKLRNKSPCAAAVDATSVLAVNQPYNATKYIEQEARSRPQGNQTMSEVKSLEQTDISLSPDGSQDHKLQIRGLPAFRIKELDATEEDWNLNCR